MVRESLIDIEKTVAINNYYKLCMYIAHNLMTSLHLVNETEEMELTEPIIPVSN